MSNSANFAPLGEMEITRTGDIFEACELIRQRASNASLITLQWAYDVERALATVPVDDVGGWHGVGADTPAKRSWRVARHAYRSAFMLQDVAQLAARMPRVYLATFSDVIQQRRESQAFDPKV